LLFESISHTVTSIWNFTILLLLFIYVYTLLGMQFFAGQLKFNEAGEVDFEQGVSPRTNFDTFGTALITVFEILVGDRWNLIMYMAMRARGYATCLYFFSWIILGNIILLNLFLAIIIGNFEESSIIMNDLTYIENYQKLMSRQNSLSKMEVLDQNTVINSAPRVKINQIANFGEIQFEKKWEAPQYDPRGGRRR